MRLICPECNALYDIADAMIPPDGREVECSACGHVWLQLPATAASRDQVASVAAPSGRADAQAPAAAISDVDTRPVPQDPRSGTMRGLAADLRAAALTRDDKAPVLGDAPVLQRPLPDDVLSILREETARELGARRAGRADGNAPPEAVRPAPTPAPAPDASRIPAGPHDAPDLAEEPLTDWPATTVTRPDVSRPEVAHHAVVTADESPATLGAAPAVPTAPDASPRRTDAAPTPVPDLGPAPLRMPKDAPAIERPPVPRRRVSRGLPDVEQLAATIQTETLPPVPAALPERAVQTPSGYRTGFARAISVAAALLVAYVAGAAWVNSGRAPDAVVSLVGGVDHVRAGLQDAVAAILGRKEP